MRNIISLFVLVTMLATPITVWAGTVNEQYPEYVEDYDPEVPLKNYIDAFGLRIMPVTQDMIDFGAAPWSVTRVENDWDKLGKGEPLDYTTWAGLNAGGGGVANVWAYLTGQMEFLIAEPHLTQEEIRQDEEVTDEIKKFLKSFDWRNASEEERAIAAAKWVCQAMYDYDAAANPEECWGRYAYAYGSHGALVLKKAVCNGLVAAYIDICRSLGLKAASYSTSLDHVSNEVYIDGVWYEFDPTSYAGKPADWIRFESSFHPLNTRTGLGY